MNPEEQVEKQGTPAEGKPAGSEPSQNRRRPGPPRRPQFRRGNRGGDRGRADSDAPRQRQPEGEGHGKQVSSSTASSSTIRDAIVHVEQIRMDLKKVLDDIQEVLQILDQAEREKNGTEDEIEQLRDSLRTLQREPSHSRPRNFPPRPHVQPPPPSSSSSSEPEETPERDEGI